MLCSYLELFIKLFNGQVYAILRGEIKIQKYGI